ncbi:MAG TPA: HEAT repeat domain-containing protein, partial [Terriglobales bacterium]
RAIWDDIVTGRVAAREWRLKPLDCEIVEAILLDNIEMAAADQLPSLLACLRNSGLLDMRIHEARISRGWKRRTALVALGRTRALEAVPALAEALDASSEETRVAAVRGLGRTGLPAAALPLLDRLLAGEFRVPEHTLKNALANCCRNEPGLLVSYLNDSAGKTRELIARVLGEVASPKLGDELLILAADPLPEVRASAARALAAAPASTALPALTALVADSEWFVRLRAVVSLGSMQDQGRVRPLLRALCDRNRHVRQRAAWVLARLGHNLEIVLEQVVDTEDSYALQAFISELERSGEIENVVQALQGRGTHYSVESVLLDALTTGRKRMEAAMTAAAGGR